MYIGYMGPIVFYTAFNNVITPSEILRSGEARWAEHDVMLDKPVSQFIGPSLEQVGFKILLSKSLGQSPESMLKKLRNMRDTGSVFPLIIGGKPISQNYFRIMSMDESDMMTDGYGKTISITVSLSLKEYNESNVNEEKSLLNQYDKRFNQLSTLLGR